MLDKKRNFLFQVLIKSVILFGLINISCGLTLAASISNLTIYNSIVPGRERFPFGGLNAELQRVQQFGPHVFITRNQCSESTNE